MSLYSTINFPTKKALKDAVKRRLRWLELTADPMFSATTALHDEFPNGEPSAITLFQPNNMFGIVACINGSETVEGPHSPRPHTWYARCSLENSEVVKVS